MKEEVKIEFKALPEIKEGFIGAILNVNKPAPKMKDIRNDGKMRIGFNNKMIFPSNFAETVNSDRRR